MSRGFVAFDLENANNVGNELILAAKVLDRNLTDMELELGRGVIAIYTTFAPKRSLRLARSIRARFGKSYFDVFTDARNPQTGYNYTPVTRFGHRAEWIYPKAETFRSRNVSFRVPVRHALTVHLRDGGIILRPRVRGFKPRSDWVMDARPSIAKLFEDKSSKFLEQTSRRVFSRGR